MSERGKGRLADQLRAHLDDASLILRVLREAAQRKGGSLSCRSTWLSVLIRAS